MADAPAATRTKVELPKLRISGRNYRTTIMFLVGDGLGAPIATADVQWLQELEEIAHRCNVHDGLTVAFGAAIEEAREFFLLEGAGHVSTARLKQLHAWRDLLVKAEGRAEAPTHKCAEWSNDLGYCRHPTCTEVSDAEATNG